MIPSQRMGSIIPFASDQSRTAPAKPFQEAFASQRKLPAVFSALAVTRRRGRRSREPEPSQSPSSSLGHGDRREQRQETVFAGIFSVSLIVFIFLFCYLERCFDLSLSFCADRFMNYDRVSCFVEFTISCSEWMNEWIFAFARVGAELRSGCTAKSPDLDI